MLNERKHGPLQWTDGELSWFESLEKPMQKSLGLLVPPGNGSASGSYGGAINNHDIALLQAERTRDALRARVRRELGRSVRLRDSIKFRRRTFFTAQGELAMAGNEVWNSAETVSRAENLARFTAFYKAAWTKRLEHFRKIGDERFAALCWERLSLLDRGLMVVPVNWRGARLNPYYFNKRGRPRRLRKVSVWEAHRRMMEYLKGVKHSRLTPSFSDPMHGRDIRHKTVPYLIAFFVKAPFWEEPAKKK